MPYRFCEMRYRKFCICCGFNGKDYLCCNILTDFILQSFRLSTQAMRGDRDGKL